MFGVMLFCQMMCGEKTPYTTVCIIELGGQVRRAECTDRKNTCVVKEYTACTSY